MSHARYLTLTGYGGGQLPKYPTINIYPPFGPVAPPGFAFLLLGGDQLTIGGEPMYIGSV